MGWLGTHQNYEGLESNNPDAAYDDYGDRLTFQERVNDLQNRFAPNGQTLLIVGSGPGYTVEKAITAGYDAWGCDASQWVVDNAGSYITSTERILFGDALDSASMDNVRSSIGVPGNKKIDIVVTEDLLSCFTDQEVQTCLPIIRGISQANVLHIVTCARPDWWYQYPDDIAAAKAQDLTTRDPEFNWKTLDEWGAILSPPDVVIDSQGLIQYG